MILKKIVMKNFNNKHNYKKKKRGKGKNREI